MPLQNKLFAMQLDPEFTATVDVIRRGMFGYEDFFSDVLDSITRGPDYYLLANDFQSYIQAQVMLIQMCHRCVDIQPCIRTLASLAWLLAKCNLLRYVRPQGMCLQRMGCE